MSTTTTIITAEDRKPSTGQFRIVTRIYNDEDLVTSSERGAIILPGRFTGPGVWTPTDVSSCPTSIQQAAAELWTPEAIEGCKAAFPWVEPEAALMPWQQPPAEIDDPPLDLVRIGSARLAIEGWDVTSIDRTQGLSVAFVADTDIVWIFFDEPQLDTDYLVTPSEGVAKYADHIEVTKPGLAAVSLIVQRII